METHLGGQWLGMRGPRYLPRLHFVLQGVETCVVSIIVQVCWSYGSRAQNGRRKNFLGTRPSLLSQFIDFFCPTSFSIFWRMFIYTHVCCVQTVYELRLLTNNIASDTFLHKSGAVTGRIRDVGQSNLLSLFHAGKSSNSSYFHIFFLMALLE